MRELLSKLVGKKIDLFCGGSSLLHGKLVKVDESLAHMVDDDDRMFYVSIGHIRVVSESRESEQKAGFTAGFLRK